MPVIPTVFFWGFIAGLFGGRTGWWMVPVAAFGWLALLATGGDSGVGIFGDTLAAANAAIGVALGHAVHWVVSQANDKVRGRT